MNGILAFSQLDGEAHEHSMSDTATMHIDGASRGNPGPAAYAVVLARPGKPVVEEANTIGNATNNIAEYTALVEGLQLAAELGVERLSVFSDSELMVKQMRGEYRVKNPELLELYQEAKQLVAKFEKLTLTHVRREQNARADAIGNDALDGKPRKRGSDPGAFEERPRATEHRPSQTHQQNAQPPSDVRVREDALMILRSAADAWASRGVGAVPVAAVWEQLWSVLEEGGVLKKPKKR
jgi:ribonuclease HI